jgi:glycosyltransferase involved in cell wall biosynthesis
VLALGIQGPGVPGIQMLRYKVAPPAQPTPMPLLKDFETKTVRGAACGDAMAQLKQQGFVPDVIVAHPGWGEALFCKDVWPQARLVVFAEFFYAAEGADHGFDPEFPDDSLAMRAKIRIKNTVHLHALSSADAGYAPTHWQQSQVPPEYRSKIGVIFDGIDTDVVAPDAGASVTLAGGRVLTVADEVITFVNRNLEPYRGFHVFMRALPAMLAARPNAQVLIIGRDDVSYGVKPAEGGTWREKMLKEVGEHLPLDRVHFLGGLPYADYLKVMQISSCHVYLTYPFVLSWSCLEAMSVGKVVVGSRTPPVQEVIEHGQNGLLFDFFDVQGLAKQVVDVLGKPEAHRLMGQNARDSVIARYDLRRKCLPEQLALVLGT